jgi:hypothetical protein
MARGAIDGPTLSRVMVMVNRLWQAGAIVPETTIREWLALLATLAASLSALFAGLIWWMRRKRLSSRFEMAVIRRNNPKVVAVSITVTNRAMSDCLSKQFLCVDRLASWSIIRRALTLQRWRDRRLYNKQPRLCKQAIAEKLRPSNQQDGRCLSITIMNSVPVRRFPSRSTFSKNSRLFATRKSK